MALEAALEDENYRVETAANGKQGLERLAEARADIVLLDMMMPVMNGLRCSRRCRRHRATARHPRNHRELSARSDHPVANRSRRRHPPQALHSGGGNLEPSPGCSADVRSRLLDDTARECVRTDRGRGRIDAVQIWSGLSPSGSFRTALGLSFSRVDRGLKTTGACPISAPFAYRACATPDLRG